MNIKIISNLCKIIINYFKMNKLLTITMPLTNSQLMGKIFSEINIMTNTIINNNSGTPIKKKAIKVKQLNSLIKMIQNSLINFQNRITIIKTLLTSKFRMMISQMIFKTALRYLKLHL